MVRTRRIRLVTGVFGLLWLVSCGGGPHSPQADDVAPIPRRLVVWLDSTGVDADTVSRLLDAGVDELVVRRGSILISGGAPVVRLEPAPVVGGALPVAVALQVLGLDDREHDADADAVWSALAADFGDRLPAELVLDLPELGDGAASFVTRLIATSGLAVVPLLSLDQLETEVGRKVASAATRCLVPAFGSQSADLRGLEARTTRPLDVKLDPIRNLGVKVRVGIALRPATDPEVAGWAEDVDPLTSENDAEILRTSALDRSFIVRRALDWAGASFEPGQTIAAAWVDAPKLNSFFVESQRLLLPEIVGWDLISLPPDGTSLGLGRDELIRYLGGEGPAPTIEVRVNRRGRNLAVELSNTSVFRSALTGVGNWLQVELESGALVAEDRGEFDRVILGRIIEGRWQPNPAGGPDAVRFVENYVAPGEVIETGTIRLPSSRSEVTVRWQVQLSDGSTVSGAAR
jgi:hypothetical protein